LTYQQRAAKFLEFIDALLLDEHGISGRSYIKLLSYMDMLDMGVAIEALRGNVDAVDDRFFLPEGHLGIGDQVRKFNRFMDD